MHVRAKRHLRFGSAIAVAIAWVLVCCAPLRIGSNRALAGVAVNSLASLRILYARLFHMEAGNDFESELAFMRKYTVPGWVSIDPNGVSHSRDEVLSALEDAAAGRSFSDMPQGAHLALNAILIGGRRAIVRTELREPTVYLSNSNVAEPAESTIVHYRDVWDQTPQGWRWISHEESTAQSDQPQ